MNKISDYLKLFKFRLSLTVVFSSIVGFILPNVTYNFKDLLLLIAGGSFLVFSANAFNQISEIKEDLSMLRTKKRPLPSNKISINEAVVISSIIFIISILLLHNINSLSSSFGFLAFFIYVFCYTPLKKKTPFSIIIGAISGSLPFMLGWVARTNDFSIEPGYLFVIQFLWQFPHFFAIVSLQMEDYKNAGFKMIFNTGGVNINNMLSCVFSFLLIPLLTIPYNKFELLGELQVSMLFVILLILSSSIYFYYSFLFYKNRKHQDKDLYAKKLKYFSYLFLPLVQMILILDKFFGG